MTTYKMHQAVRTQSGRAKPVLSRGGGGGSRQCGELVTTLLRYVTVP
jgi:hypothetical protein